MMLLCGVLSVCVDVSTGRNELTTVDDDERGKRTWPGSMAGMG